MKTMLGPGDRVDEDAKRLALAGPGEVLGDGVVAVAEAHAKGIRFAEDALRKDGLLVYMLFSCHGT